MWVAVKPFRYRGVRYAANEQVPAERWVGRRALVSMRKIRFVPESEVILPLHVIRNMKRAELNDYAKAHGIPDAEEYRNRDSLLEQIEKMRGTESEEEDDTTPPKTSESEDGESEEETSENESEEEDDLFAEDEEDDLFTHTEDTPSE